jgi:hypothetical protein
MTRNLLATCFLSLAFAGVGIAQGTASSPETGAHYTQAQLKQLALNAHAPAQYTALASYYGERQNNYLQRPPKRSRSGSGEPERHERGSQVSTACRLGTQSLRVLHVQGFRGRGTLEAKYSRLAAPNAPVNAQ